jgi:hypothetical protein
MVSKQFKAVLHILTKNCDAKTNPLITFQVCYQEYLKCKGMILMDGFNS